MLDFALRERVRIEHLLELAMPQIGGDRHLLAAALDGEYGVIGGHLGV